MALDPFGHPITSARTTLPKGRPRECNLQTLRITPEKQSSIRDTGANLKLPGRFNGKFGPTRYN
jgi:hypothetical protein